MSKLAQIRNIGIIAHIDAGKTTVTERMLYVSGAKHRVGKVDSGTTDTDDDAEEQERGITIYSACVKLRWGDYDINLLDTPGHVDFTAEVERCLRVLDGAVVVFSAREGVEAQSETVWRQANKYNVPRIVFINKMDREGADFYSVLDEIRPRLDATPVAIQIPVGSGPAHMNDPFEGVIDLVELKYLKFNPGSEGKEVVVADIPEAMVDEVAVYREQLIDSLSNIDDGLLELAMEEKDIPAEMVRKALREGCVGGGIQPVLCGSALHGVGVQPVLDAVGSYLPSPLDRPPVSGVDPKDETVALTRETDPKAPFCGLVFKILPAKTGDNYWIRVYSGQLKQNSRVYVPNRDKKENVAQIWQIHASKKERDGQIDMVEAGDIACVIGPRFGITGDTVCDTRELIELPSITFAETVISVAIEPESTADKKKLSETLEMFRRQDPTFDAKENEETGQTLISGMGELHLEVVQHRLTRDFGLKVKFYKPRVNYRETIGGNCEAIGACNRQIGAVQMFAKVKVSVEPLEDPSAPAIVLDNCPPDGGLPDEFRVVVLDELKNRLHGGGMIAGFPLSGLRLRILGAEAAEEGSDAVAFRIAASDAFEQALNGARPVLLEPVMLVEISTPDEYMGEIVGDLQQRRAIIAKTESRGAITTIISHAPLNELFGYSSAIRSLSHGRAGASMEPHGYQPAPSEDAENFSF